MTTAEAPSNSARYRFVMTSPSGLESDLSDLIYDGAKLTVLFDQLVYDWKTNHKAGWAYDRLRRQCLKWRDDGLLSYSKQNTYDSCFAGIEQRPGVFIRAIGAAVNTPYLIKPLQNSKLVAAPQNGLIFEDGISDDEGVRDKLDWLPGNKIGWYRLQAIKRLQNIKNPYLFVREKMPDGKAVLNPSLVKMQNQVSKMFEAWKQDCIAKQIVLKDQNTGKYLRMDYKTRFTDPYRHFSNVKTYQTAIRKSTEMFDTGVFITLTADPQIHMRTAGEEFERHVKDPNTGTTYTFNLTGRGGNLWSANRSESKAWRYWYENLCHRYGGRVPYVRVVEFQKNGLIHTHLLLFGIEYKDSWEALAREWGERYGQGIMNQVYRVKNVDGVWQWANQGEQPDDTRGRAPADYLGKYLKKASDIPTVKCPHCGEIVSTPVSGDIECPHCHAKLHAPRDGRYMYWVCGKRFFTISQCLREYDFDTIIEKEALKELSPYEWKFLGAVETGSVDKLIADDFKKSNPNPEHLHGKGSDYYSPIAKLKRIDWQVLRERFKGDPESPDINDDALSAILLQQPTPQPDIMTAEQEYKELMEQERQWRKQHREQLRLKRIAREQQQENKS